MHAKEIYLEKVKTDTKCYDDLGLVLKPELTRISTCISFACANNSCCSITETIVYLSGILNLRNKLILSFWLILII